jgi:hypothetical protein
MLPIEDNMYELVNKATLSINDKDMDLSSPKLFEMRLGN